MPDQMRLRTLSPEVLASDGGFLAVDGTMVERLKSGAAASDRRRCRLCFHADASSAQQEMLIVMHRSAYVRPHRHLAKVETLTVIEGEADALLFHEDGAVARQIAMGAPGGSDHFFYRVPPGQFHTLVFRSEWLVFLETTIGPFDPAASEPAPWAPGEDRPDEGRADLTARLERFQSAARKIPLKVGSEAAVQAPAGTCTGTMDQPCPRS